MRKKKIFVCSGYLERDGKHQCSWASEVCLSEKNKVLHALDFVSINLLFRGKTQVLRKTTFVTVCSWNCLSNSKRLYHFDSRSSPFSQQEGKRREAKTLTSEVS